MVNSVFGGEYIGRKFCLLYPARPTLELITIIGEKVAPIGTLTVKLFTLEETTVALVSPKKTILSPLFTLNPDPEIVTTLPGTAEAGENAVIVGAWASISS